MSRIEMLQYGVVSATSVTVASNYDVLTWISLALSNVFSPEASDVVASFIGVIIGASAGAMWSLSKRPNGVSALFYFLRMILTALVLTTALSFLLAKYLNIEVVQWLYPLVAFAIGYGGDKWESAIPWLVGVLKHWIERLAGKG